MVDKEIKSQDGVVETLQKDLDEYWDGLESNDSPFLRRGFVRAAFALIEGLAYSMKLAAVFRHKYLRDTAHLEFEKAKNQGTGADLSLVAHRAFSRMARGAGFSDHELNLLLEVTEDIDDKGQRQVRWGSKMSLEKSILFAFRALGQSFNVQFLLDKGDACWGHLKTSIKVRDRLMHPKRPTDLDVTDDELEATMKAYTWLLKQETALAQLRRAAVEEGRDAPTFETTTEVGTPNDDV